MWDNPTTFIRVSSQLPFSWFGLVLVGKSKLALNLHKDFGVSNWIVLMNPFSWYCQELSLSIILDWRVWRVSQQKCQCIFAGPPRPDKALFFLTQPVQGIWDKIREHYSWIYQNGCTRKWFGALKTLILVGKGKLALNLHKDFGVSNGIILMNPFTWYCQILC